MILEYSLMCNGLNMFSRRFPIFFYYFGNSVNLMVNTFYSNLYRFVFFKVLIDANKRKTNVDDRNVFLRQPFDLTILTQVRKLYFYNKTGQFFAMFPLYVHSS